MNVWFWVFISYILINFALMVSMIFFERKKLTSVLAWMAVLTFLPWIGFLAYIVFGSGLSYRVRRLLHRYKLYDLEFNDKIKSYFDYDENQFKNLEEDKETIKCAHNYGAVLCPNNDIQIFHNGEEKINALLKDIENAKNSINIEYYIFSDDAIGKKVMNALIKKAQEGVKVRLIFDSIGCLGAPRRFFKRLKEAGGEVGEFFPPFMYIRMINLKLNYRNHKKIVVIDGKIAYTGGINIRDDHMGKKKKVSPWRDTHIRITGSGVVSLQMLFLNDWRYVKNDKSTTEDYFKEKLFPTPSKKGNAFVQILSSGPDSETQEIKETYIKLITNAKKSVLIQTPYFIPDDSFLTAIRIAVSSGVKVKIMVPSKPDYRSIYHVTLSYLKDIIDLGIEVYLYKGFLHAKTLVIDDDKLSIGTCNIDNRSFQLNFEDTALIYSKELNEEYSKVYEEDIKNSIVADKAYFKKKKWLTKFLQAIFRLFAPIL